MISQQHQNSLLLALKTQKWSQPDKIQFVNGDRLPDFSVCGCSPNVITHEKRSDIKQMTLNPDGMLGWNSSNLKEGSLIDKLVQWNLKVNQFELEK
jgi:hypothetical protein